MEYELQNLRQEFDIQKNLRHPNIVHILGAFETLKEVIFINAGFTLKLSNTYFI